MPEPTLEEPLDFRPEWFRVAQTGYGKKTDKLRSENAGFNHHLVKPADFGKVEQILATLSQTAT